MSLDRPLSLTVAALTYRRPDQLAILVPLLREQVKGLTGLEGRNVHCDLLIIDNDAAASGAEVVAQLKDEDLRYVVEPKPGISAARNRALTESKDTDLLVFIDDDERPQPGWLSNLLQTYSKTGAAAVAGAVVSEFLSELDPWIAAGGFFIRRRLPTGSPIRVAATNNLLLDLRQIREMELAFDERFGLTGAEDTLFTRKIASSGRTMVWCDEAVVTDTVPPERATRRWVLLRQFSSGNSWSLVCAALAAPGWARFVARVRAGGTAVPRITGGSVVFLLGLIGSSQRRQARGLRMIARGGGLLAGSLGIGYQEYRRQS